MLPSMSWKKLVPMLPLTLEQIGRYDAQRAIRWRSDGMVERFNGRVGSEVLSITIHSHAQLEQLLRGFNAAYKSPSARSRR